MKVLIACERSGITRDAFTWMGHDAWSCDIVPSESPGNHLECDVLEVLGMGWDLMIAHPPCTYLSFAGNRHWNAEGRVEMRMKAETFFMKLYNADIPKIAIENPVGIMNRVFRKPDMIIHPYHFGEPEMKRTCFWLKNLPPLWYWKTNLKKPEPITNSGGKKRYFTETNKGQSRSRTFKSIALAMAQQWGKDE